MTLTLVMRKPPRCFDCEHAVGSEGDHYYPGHITLASGKRFGIVLCRRCPKQHHIVSMAMPYERFWSDSYDRWTTRIREALA